MSKSTQDHKYVLVLVNYAMRYPEAVPLLKATSRNITQELFFLFS